MAVFLSIQPLFGALLGVWGLGEAMRAFTAAGAVMLAGLTWGGAGRPRTLEFDS